MSTSWGGLLPTATARRPDGSAATSLLTVALPTTDYTVTGTGNCNAGGPGSTFTCTIAETPDIGAADGTASVICTP